MIAYPSLSQTGRLGNQLWEVASTYGLASARGDVPSFPVWDYQEFFSCPDEWFVTPCVGELATDLVPHLDPRSRAYLQDFNLFKDVQGEVRNFLRPSLKADEILASYGLGRFNKRISVHIRRGDNVTHPQGYHPLRSWDYYRSALDLVDPDGSIIVFSDDPSWCEEHFERETGRKPVQFFEAGGPRPREYVDRLEYENAPVLDWIDLQLMAECDEHILSNSTYAWWGAFLSANMSPIYPSNWFGWRLPYIDASLMFPEGWREVNDPTMEAK